MSNEIVACGIDPGQKGGIGILHNDFIVAAYPMPVLNKKVLVQDLMAIIDAHDPLFVVIEMQTIMGGQKGAMAIGSNFGRIMAVVELLGKSHRLVTPTSWNRSAGIPAGLKGRAKKEASFDKAKQTWGKGFTSLGITPSKDGLVEALLIARYG